MTGRPVNNGKLTAELAHRMWRYEPETGHFFHRTSPRYGIVPGDKAGFCDGQYMRVSFKRRNFKCARVAWLMIMGNWPSGLIDHINRNKMDDRFLNLREATSGQNSMNRVAYQNNRLGIKGVSKARGNRIGYNATISADGKRKYLGYFYSAEDAGAAYEAAARELHGEFART